MGMARTFCGKYSSAEDSDARSGGHGGLKESELAGKFRGWFWRERLGWIAVRTIVGGQKGKPSIIPPLYLTVHTLQNVSQVAPPSN